MRSKRQRVRQSTQKQPSAMRSASAEVNNKQILRHVSGKMLPWATWENWLHLKHFLAANDHVAARALLSIFNLHRRSAVPVAVSSSVELVSLLNCRNERAVPLHNRRLALGMAIIRFINGMTDFLQPRDVSQQTQTVAANAARLRLPPLLVEIRHHASHNQLPPLPTLEEGARQALYWLDVFYWQKQHDRLRERMLLPEDNAQVVEELRSVFGHKSYNKLRSLSGSSRIAKSSTKPFAARGSAGEEVLDKLLQSIQDWPPLVEQTDPTKSVVGCYETSHGIWSECENRQEWLHMPIGLIPGQNAVPPIPLQYFFDSRIEHPENISAVYDDESCDSCDDIEIDDVVLNAKPSTAKVSQLQEKRRAKLKLREQSLIADQVELLQGQIDKGATGI